MKYGDALLTVQLAAERVHDDLCPAYADGVTDWHQCRYRPSLIATADALDAIIGGNAPSPEQGAAWALHARSCIDKACGPAEALGHASKYDDAALSLVAYVDDLIGDLRPIPQPRTEDSSATENRRGKVRNDHPETARKAAVDVAPKTGTQRSLVLLAIRDAPFGLTDPEIAEETGLPLNSVRPRRVELVEGEWVENSGRVRMIHGHEHTAWTVTDKTRERFPVASPTPVR